VLCERTVKEMKETLETWVKMFHALAEEKRLRILLLFVAFQEGLCVCELVDALRIPQYVVSRHLAVLKKAGMVTTKKQGLWVYYGINKENPDVQRIQQLCLALRYLPEFVEDWNRLERRLSLRKEGRCVVGFKAEDNQNLNA